MDPPILSPFKPVGLIAIISFVIAVWIAFETLL